MESDGRIGPASTASLPAKAIIVIVGYSNSADVVDCLRALADAKPEPTFEVFVAENGGPSAMDTLREALVGDDGCCIADAGAPLPVASPAMLRSSTFRLVDTAGQARSRVHIAEMAENLGYAGGVNAWLRPLLEVPGWEGVWVLNPDTRVMPTALAELVAYAAASGKGMVGSRLISQEHSAHQQTRGLTWRKVLANTLAVDSGSPVTPSPNASDVEARIDAPSGASCYVTRDLLQQIGLMDERYFLYFEDLEWGCRAKAVGSVGYAHMALVRHQGGTTIGTSRTRATMSSLAVYLEFRNRILFVRDRHPQWLVWTVFMQIVHAASFGASGAFKNMRFAYRGLFAGINGEAGRPDGTWSALSRTRARPGGAKRRLKIAISCLYWIALRVARLGSTLTRGRVASNTLVVLYYHAVPDRSRSGFARQMDYLRRHAQVLPADFAGEVAIGKPAVAITFDDAFASVADNALPILKACDFPCTIFVPSGVVGRAPDWTMETKDDCSEVVMQGPRLAALQGPLVTFGAHSVNHPHLTRLAPEQARAEIRGSRDALSAIFGRPITLFAFPYGDYDSDVAKLCQQEGFDHAFTISPERIDVRRGAFLRGRVAVDPDDGALEFALKVSGAYAWMLFVPTVKYYCRNPFARPHDIAPSENKI